MKLYKVTGKDGVACNGGQGRWYLPKNGKPGKWMPPIKGKLEPCENGYHLCRLEDLLRWLNAEIYEAEGRGDMVGCEDKVVYREARLMKKIEPWDERTARLFAADCAEHVLPIFEKELPNDDRPRKAIQATRNFANGKISKKELAAARDAAGAAEEKWQLEKLAEYLGL